MNERDDNPPLSAVQRWFQAVITDPAGLASSVPRINELIAPSSQLSATDRLAVYANAFHARLIECLGETFPILKGTLGDDVFRGFAMDYLQAYPSKSYTLGELGTQFPRYLGESRPPREGDEPDWADFLIELATLEWTIERVFDGPGIERMQTLAAERLAAIPPARRPSLRLKTAPCLKLLAFRFPVNAYFTAMHGDDSATSDMPAARDTWLAITRRAFVVRRIELSRPQFELLGAMQRGEPLSQAILAASEWQPEDENELAREIQTWFEQWTAMGLFIDVVE